eukprot:gene5213-18440_t
MIRGASAIRGLLSNIVERSAATCSYPCSSQASARHMSSATPEVDLKAAQAALASLQNHVDQISQISKLAALSAAYRDIFVAADALHQNQQAMVTESARGQPMGRKGRETDEDVMPPPVFPMLDASNLPDSNEPLGPPKLQQRFMDKITCWSQLLPSHVETSNHLIAGVNLFPPQEASFPTYINFNAGLRKLDHHKSGKRMNLLRKLKRRTDKYQLGTWGHIVGNA